MQPIAMVTDISGKSEPLYESKGFKLIEEVNGEYSLSFLILNSEKNKHAFPLVKEESVIEYKGIAYRIKNVNERNTGNRSAKTIIAHHKMFDLIDRHVYGVVTGTRTLYQTLNFIFAGTQYTFDVVDTFASVELEDFGEDNVLSLLQEVLGIYKAEIDINNTHIRFKKKIGNKSDIQFRYKHNVKTINKDVNSNNISTYIKGYGKLKEKQDILSGVKIPYASRSGTWYTEPGLNQLATSTVGASFRFNFTGTGFTFDTILTFLGGKWEFTIDGNKSIKITTYKDVVSEHKTIEIIRGLEHKSHSVVATFKGKDSKNPYTNLKSDPNPIVYLKSGNIISLYRGLAGDEQYMAVAEYTSPNASKFPSESPDGLKHAPPIYDEKFTSVTPLREMLKENLQDEPEVSIAIDFAELRNAGYPYQHPIKGDEVFLIYEPMDIDIVTRIMRIETEENSNGDVVKCVVTLSNVGKSFSKVVGGFATTAKRLNRILTDDDKIKHDFLGDAVKRMTAVLQSAETELEFENGIIARDKTNPNNLVLFNSAGLGISTNGGDTFDTAMTAEGIVADAITTGTLRAIIIDGVEIYGSKFFSANGLNSMVIEGGDIHLEQASGSYMDIGPSGMYGYNQGGSVRFQADSTLVTSSAFGTSNANVYLAAQDGFEARVVDMRDVPGDGLIGSYRYLPIRSSGVYANFWNINTAAGNNATNLYARPLTAGELRITLNGTTDQYRDLRNRITYTTGVSLNTMYGLSDNLFLRAVNEIRMTALGTDDTYIKARALEFVVASSQRFKENIESWEIDAIEAMKHINFVKWNPVGHPEDMLYGMVVEDEGTPEFIKNGDGISESIRDNFFGLAVQQLIKRVEAIEGVAE